tara:strand:- start:883 stop:2004 length:1122 start_codon:yes stop_codon:yes gene_type:complete
MKLNTISEAIKDLKNNKIIIVVDDENRENEGDFIFPAEIISPEVVNFMATHGRGLICVPLTSNRCERLHLNPMVSNNTELMDTAFTVSVDLKGNGVTSGISAIDRSKTIQALVDDSTTPENLLRPGHIFPLSAKDGGVLRRTGHTEAAVDISRLAGFKPAGVICEIMNEDGTMARLPELFKVAKRFNLKIISIEDLVSYRMDNDSLIELIDVFEMETTYGKFSLNTFKEKNNDRVHLALSKGKWKKDEPVLCRVNSLGSINNSIDDLILREDFTLRKITKKINDENKGVIVFVNQDHETRPILNRINHIKKTQIEGNTHKPFKKMDVKDFGIGAQILHKLNITKIKLLTTKDRKIKRVGMGGYGLEIVKTVKF